MIDFEKVRVTSETKAILIEAEQKLIGFPTLAGKDGAVVGVEWGHIGGDINDQTDLGSMAQIDDAPSDGEEYVRKNGEWAISSGGGGGSAEWGDITGTLSDQTDLQNALDAKADSADLGDLAYEDSVDYSDVTNTPTLGDLADHDTVDYATEVTNKPTLGTMASVNDAASDSKTYGRKNGNWVEVTGGGGGGGSATWGDIGGTLSDQTDLADALNSKPDSFAVESDFDPSHNYIAGNTCMYQSRLYRFSVSHTGAWNPSDVTEIQIMPEMFRSIVVKASIDSPTFIGTPKAPTPTAGDNSTKIATTAFVQGEISGKHLHISMASTSSLGTISNAAITTTMRVVNLVWGTPANVTSDVSWNTNTAGQLVLSGTLKGATTAEIDLIDFG